MSSDEEEEYLSSDAEDYGFDSGNNEEEPSCRLLRLHLPITERHAGKRIDNFFKDTNRENIPVSVQFKYSNGGTEFYSTGFQFALRNFANGLTSHLKSFDTLTLNFENREFSTNAYSLIEALSSFRPGMGHPSLVLKGLLLKGHREDLHRLGMISGDWGESLTLNDIKFYGPNHEDSLVLQREFESGLHRTVTRLRVIDCEFVEKDLVSSFSGDTSLRELELTLLDRFDDSVPEPNLAWLFDALRMNKTLTRLEVWNIPDIDYYQRDVCMSVSNALDVNITLQHLSFNVRRLGHLFPVLDVLRNDKSGLLDLDVGFTSEENLGKSEHWRDFVRMVIDVSERNDTILQLRFSSERDLDEAAIHENDNPPPTLKTIHLSTKASVQLIDHESALQNWLLPITNDNLRHWEICLERNSNDVEISNWCLSHNPGYFNRATSSGR